MMTSVVFRDLATPAMWARVFVAAKAQPFEAQRDLYREYIDSAAWDRRRHEELAKAGGECSECRNKATATIPLQVHHLSYERLGAELPSDVVVLCRLCHECRHGRSQIARVVEAMFGKEDPEREREREENKRKRGHYRGRGGVE